jgi:hypothetical protein
MRRPGAGDGGHAGGGHFLAGDSAAAEMVDQAGPAGRGLAGPEAYVIGQFLAEPVSEVGQSPGGRELAAEVAQCHLVDLDYPVAADRTFLPGRRPGEHAVDVGVGLLRRPGDATD